VIARRYKIGVDALRRHKAAHLSPALVKMALARRTDESAVAYEATVGRIESLIERLEALLGVAEDRKSLVGGANIARELRQCLELVAKLRGELDERPVSQTINVLSSPEFGRVVATIISTLEPFPEARVAIADKLEAIEAKAVER
jgi:hypothetical protein